MLRLEKTHLKYSFAKDLKIALFLIEVVFYLDITEQLGIL